MKAYTDIEQSRKLTEILPLESADLSYNNASIRGINYVDELRMEPTPYLKAKELLSPLTINPLFEVIPCWSLASLFDILPPGKILVHDKETREYKFIYLFNDIDFHSNPIDACYELILLLYEKGEL